MQDKALEEYTFEEAGELVRKTVDAIILVDTTLGKYKTLSRKGIFTNFF